MTASSYSSSKSRKASENNLERGGHAVRSLTLFDGIATIVGLMVGSGIFSTAGEIQKGVGSSGAALLLWVLTGFLALTGALCYAELGTMIPGCGGEAQYLARAFGPLAVFLFNWTSILILKPGTVAILSVATAEYVLGMFASMGLLQVNNDLFAWMVKGASVLTCVLVTMAAAISTRWSNRLQSVLTFGKIGALGLVIGAGAYWAVFKNTAMIKDNLSEPFAGSFFAFAPFAQAMNNGLWAFEGWNNLNIVAGNLHRPSVNLPMAIWISMLAVVVLYLLTLLGYYAVLDSRVIMDSETVGLRFGAVVFGQAGTVIMSLLIASSTFGSALSSMVTSSEIVVLAASTGHIPSIFGVTNRKLGTAMHAYLLQGGLATLLVFFTGFKTLIMVYTFPQFVFYAACVLVLLKLRWTEPHLLRPYRVWLSTPILFLLACVWLLSTSLYADPIPVGLSFGVILLGIPVYFAMQRFFKNNNHAIASPLVKQEKEEEIDGNDAANAFISSDKESNTGSIETEEHSGAD